MSNIIDIEEIKNTIPHRFPILLVDRITQLELNKSIKAYKNITANEAIFNGHFPKQSIYPGVYTIEGLAQVATFLAFKSLNLNSDSLVYFAGMDKVKFKKPVVPGDRLDYECNILRTKSAVFIIDAKAYVDGQLVATAELKSSIQA